MKKEQGTIVIVASIATTIMMVISAYFLNSLINEIQISESMNKAERAYYLAEGGVNEAIWKLKDDPDWSSDFIDPELNPDEDGNFWSDSFEREVSNGGSYHVSVENTGLGQAQIVATAKSPFLGKEAKRETRVNIFKPLDSPTDESALFSGGGGSNVQIRNSNVEIIGGNIFSNRNLLLSGELNIDLYDNPDTESLEGMVWASQNVNKTEQVDLNSEAICAKNICDEECESCPPEEGDLPIVDFDSDSENSFYSRAERYQQDGDCSVYCQEEGGGEYKCSDQCIFSSNHFEDLLWEVGEGGVLTLKSEVTYVTGDVELRGGRNLEVEGALVADRSIDVGMREDWNRRGQRDSGLSNIEVTQKDGAAGILSKRKISFGNSALNKDSKIEGVIYSGDEVSMTGLPYKLEIDGGIIGRQIKIRSMWEGLEINFDNELMLYGMGYIIDDEAVEPIFSPVIEVDHWEEVY